VSDTSLISFHANNSTEDREVEDSPLFLLESFSLVFFNFLRLFYHHRDQGFPSPGGDVLLSFRLAGNLSLRLAENFSSVVQPLRT